MQLPIRVNHRVRAKALVAALRRRLWGAPAHVRSQPGVFESIYHSNHWRGAESRSGTGSSLAQTQVIRAALPSLLSDLGCRSMLDAPCGDFNWLSQVALEVDYHGYDVVEEVVAGNAARYATEQVHFVCADITPSQLPRVDLILCRDCLVHFSNADIFLTLRNFLDSGSRYLLTTTFPGRLNQDIVTGDWRPIDFEREPFCLPPPQRLINEECTEFDGAYRDKSLGLWDMSRW